MILPISQNIIQSNIKNNNFSYTTQVKYKPNQPAKLNFTGSPTILWQSLKNEFKFNIYILNPRNLIKIFKDPKPFEFIIFNEIIPTKGRVLLNTKPITQVTVPLRNTKENKRLNLYSKEYSDGSKTLAIKDKFSPLDLAILEYQDLGNGKISINYLTNVVGRDKYKKLEQILPQALAEEYINKGIIPEFHAQAENIGEIAISRKELYKRMGADTFNDTQQNTNQIILRKEKILELITSKINKGKQIFPNTHIKIAYAK